MGLSVKPKHLKRYRDLVWLLARYGGSDLLKTVRLDEAVLLEDDAQRFDVGGRPEELARDLESLGPTFIKLGQLLSTRPDLLPLPYLEALARLQDQVEPFAFEEVEEIVQRELGVRISRAFEQFDPEPIAAASLGQVHYARLRDGRAVAVKVQRPGVRQQILEDLDALDEIAAFVDRHTTTGRHYGFRDMLAEFRKTIVQELDYRQEAQNLVTLAENLRGYDRIVIPQPVPDYTTSLVLTMDYIRGTKVTKLSPVARTEMDGYALAEQLSNAYLDQILVDGFFHADPHPGNVFVTDDHRLALLDLGMVARVAPDAQENLLRLLLAIIEGNGHEAASLCRRLGVEQEGFDEPLFKRRIADMTARYQHARLAEIQLGRIIMEIGHISGDCGIRPVPELTMLGKTLLNLDEVGRTLAPDFNPNHVVRRHVDAIMRKRMLKSLSPAQMLSSFLEVQEFTRQLPSRANALLRALSENEFVLKVDAIDEMRFLENLHTIANRIALSVVLAALIMGAALMMRVETAFTILGYPGIAMLLFLIAAACGFVLVFSILFQHATNTRPPGRKRP